MMFTPTSFSTREGIVVLAATSLFRKLIPLHIPIDGFQLYKDVAEVYFPCAKICIDSFHVIQQVNTAFNNIRVRVMKSFETTSEEYQLLKRFNWVLMKNSSRIDLYESIDLRKYYYCFNSQYVTPRAMIDKMLSWSFELNAAYSMKENMPTSTPLLSRRMLNAG